MNKKRIIFCIVLILISLGLGYFIYLNKDKIFSECTAALNMSELINKLTEMIEFLY